MAELAKVDRSAIRRDDRTPAMIATSPFTNLFGWDPFRAFESVSTAGLWVDRTETGYDVEMPVPGFAPDQVELSYHDGLVQLSCKNDRRQLARSFTLPEEADPDTIEAQVADGMLTIHVERREQAKPRKINVKAN